MGVIQGGSHHTLFDFVIRRLVRWTKLGEQRAFFKEIANGFPAVFQMPPEGPAWPPETLQARRARWVADSRSDAAGTSRNISNAIFECTLITAVLNTIKKIPVLTASRDVRGLILRSRAAHSN